MNVEVPLLGWLRIPRNTLFWCLHGAGWVAYGCAQYLGALLYDKDPGYFQVISSAAVAGFVVTMPLRYIYRILWRKRPRTFLIGIALTSYLTALVWRLCVNLAYDRFMPQMDWKMVHWYEYLSGALQGTYLMLCWSGLYFGVKYYESLQRQREATLRSAALAQEAQLRMLRYQLNPHFLFNTLNAISTLILDSQNRVANQAVTRLSEFLRYTLDQDPMNKVTMRQELDALNMYLSTEQLRFGERLRIEFAIEERALDALVPSLLLQPLIENAVKYAVSPREGGGTIRVEGRVRGVMLELVVADDGPGARTSNALIEGRGVGLRNTRERLHVLYGNQQRFAAINAHPGVRIEIALPFEKATSP
ncbi:MAG TPA: histidine kinase [Steroidobacteraceae bacterium]|nr:histidine kinase [Steroidobacteraceae bacterium]HQX46499.1 histidine kinase [Steroidobacteraceae bacterium]HQX78288.1 histidine kinase [Steroidobacteraceae bacterium]HQZ79982.1 histidine kinase [Steroidobacteraceae bacterium]